MKKWTAHERLEVIARIAQALEHAPVIPRIIAMRLGESMSFVVHGPASFLNANWPGIDADIQALESLPRTR
jgi:hypothetical protein